MIERTQNNRCGTCFLARVENGSWLNFRVCGEEQLARLVAFDDEGELYASGLILARTFGACSVARWLPAWDDAFIHGGIDADRMEVVDGSR